MSGALEAALQLAANGFPVFPCASNKRPALHGRGFHDATTDTDQIRNMFGVAGDLAGVPTGAIAGFDVLDLDYRNGAIEWQDANLHRLPETRIHRTQSGGRHYLFRHAPGVRNTAGKIAPGIDVRGDGGYVIMPPSAGYEIVSDADIVEWPDWLLDLVLSQPLPPKSNGYHHEPISSRRLDGFVRAVCGRVEAAGEGAKHFALRNAALSLGGIQAAAGLSDAQAMDMLRSALPRSVKDWRNAEHTIAWGLAHGRNRPIELEDRELPSRYTAPSEPESAAPEEQSQGPVVEQFPATPLDWDEMVRVQPREWVYGHFLIKRFVSLLGAPGGTGKTAHSLATALCVLTGRELLGETVHEPGNVWIYNLEDPKDELYRRFWAACLHHGVEKTEVVGRVFLDSGRERPLVIASTDRNGTMIASPIVPLLVAELKNRDVRVLQVDPFVRSHRLDENDNVQMDFALSLWGQVADQANCSVLLVCHFRKGGASGDASAFRGASASIDAARAALSLSPMSEADAQRFGVEAERRWQFLRVDNAKLNLAPPPESAVWVKLVGVDLGNGGSRPSDRVQTVERWEPPSPWDGMPMSMVVRVLDKIERGPEPDEFFAFSPQSKDRWAGHILIDDACKTDGQAKAILKAWKESGLLEEGQYCSRKLKGRTTGCVRVNQQKFSEMRQQVSCGFDASE